MYNGGYLIHYGVLGMKWGVRKRNPVNAPSNYKSFLTKKLESKSRSAKNRANILKKDYANNRAYSSKARSNFSKKSEKKNSYAKKMHGQAVASQKRDRKLWEEYNSASVGKKFLNTLVAGPAGHLYVSSMKASGVSEGKARVIAMLSGAIGSTYVRNKYIQSEGKKYEKSYKNDGSIYYKHAYDRH